MASPSLQDSCQCPQLELLEQLEQLEQHHQTLVTDFQELPLVLEVEEEPAEARHHQASLACSPCLSLSPSPFSALQAKSCTVSCNWSYGRGHELSLSA